MQQKIWLGSDFHFGHRKLIENGLRERGYERKLLAMWRDCVMPNDTVLIMGDVAFTKVAYWFQVLGPGVTPEEKLPGNKVLLLGNHDTNRKGWYQKFGFKDVVPFNRVLFIDDAMGKIMVSHLPAFAGALHETDGRFLALQRRFGKLFDNYSCIFNLHGHTHGRGGIDTHCLDCTLECTDGILITLEQAKQRWKERNESSN